MERFALAKIAQWAGAGGIHGRKRLQKVIFFLKQAGCPLDADYTLHHYGPYSRDVAEACDELVGAGILAEEASSTIAGGTQYAYTLTPAGTAALASTERRRGDGTPRLEGFGSLAVELIQRDIWELELGSTILFFHDLNGGSDWDEAVRRACEFKKIDPKTDRTVNAAAALAQRVHQKANYLN